MIKISIIIPMYNVEKYIEKCVYSAFNQGLKESEFEIIAVDDESPDNSLNLVKDLAKEYSNIVIISQKNKGLGGARNTGITKAKGEYILFLDADDYIIKNSLNKILLVANNNSLDILEFGAQGVDILGNVTYQIELENNSNSLSGIGYYNHLKSINSACNKLYKNSFLTENKLVFVEKIFGEDFEFNTRALYLAEKVMSTSSIVSRFLQSENSITRSNNLEKKKKYVHDLINILRRINAFKFNFEKNKKHGHDTFFNKRMAITNIDIFFMMFKNNFSFSEIVETKEILKNENIFKVTFPIGNFKKDIFRIVCLNFNLTFFRILLYFKK